MGRGIASKETHGLCKLKSCRVRFRKKNSVQLFCCREHKDTFYRRGQFPFEKMKDEIMRAVQAELAPLRARLEAIEKQAGLRGAVEASRRFERDVLNAGGGATA